MKDNQTIEIWEFLDDGAKEQRTTDYALSADMLILPQNISDYTIDNLFELLADQYINEPTIRGSTCGHTLSPIEYDPDFGYINSFTYYVSWSYPSKGILCPGRILVTEKFRINDLVSLSSEDE